MFKTILLDLPILYNFQIIQCMDKIQKIKLITKKMHQITEQRHFRMLAKPMRQNISQSADKNIFASLRSTQPLPSLAHAQKIKGKPYDFVGSKQFKQKILETENHSHHNQSHEEGQVTSRSHYMQQSGLHQTTNFNTTINRQTILSKITRQQQNVLSRQQKQLNRYREYKQYWENQSQKLKKKTMRKKNEESLLENNVKGLYVHPNQDKLDVLNNYVVHFWEMSLRNNDKILKRHIKGNKYGQKQLEQMLQTDRGIKNVQQSIPVLPLDKLRRTRKQQLSLTGRNKALSQTYRSKPSIASTQRRSNAQTQNQEEVFKIDYTGDVKWMSMEGL